MRTLEMFLATVAVLASPLAMVTEARAGTWRVPGDFGTIQEAVDDENVVAGDRIVVSAGRHPGAVLTKAVEIRGLEGTVIDSGPMPWSDRTYMAGFLFPGDGAGSGAKIRGLTFEGVEFPIFSRGADDVAVIRNTLSNPIQGVSNWGGSRWRIGLNEIEDLRTACGGGIGILIADADALEVGVDDNRVFLNRITGTLHVDPEDCGGYEGTGIVLYADFRWDRLGALEIAGNRISFNKVGLTSDTPDLVDVVGIELTQAGLTEEDDVGLVIYDNVVMRNDLRDTGATVVLTPEDLYDVNTFRKNMPPVEPPDVSDGRHRPNRASISAPH